jgi:DNA topoisomerase-6 subunit B
MAETADNLFKEFKEHSVAEFFKKNRQMLGYSGKIRSLTTILHEYVTNGLDACEDASILPEIHCKIEQLGNDHYRVTVSDNGPGIPKTHVGRVYAQMLSGTKFHRFIQSRGQQGIGASGCTMYAQITSGRPVHVITSAKKGKVYECDVMFDVKHNQPEILKELEYDGDLQGTIVSAEFKDVTFNWSEYGPGEYLRRTAVANPHAKIVFEAPDKQKFTYNRVVNVLPQKAHPSQPHPKGLSVDDFLDYAHSSKERAIRTFMSKTFDRVSSDKAKELEGLTSIDFDRKPDSVTWKDAEEVIEAIKKVKFLAPSTKELKPIGEKQIEKSVLNVMEPKFHYVTTRAADVYRGGVPFIIEAGIAFGGKAGRPAANGEAASVEVMRFANRAPLLFDAGADVITKVVSQIDWNRYNLKNMDQLPISIIVNMTSTYIPYTSAGKQAISDEEEIFKEVTLALQEVGRKVGEHLRREYKRGEKAEKKATLLKYVPETANAVATLSGEEKKKLELKMFAMIEKKYAANGNSAEEEEEAEETAAEAEPAEEEAGDE